MGGLLYSGFVHTLAYLAGLQAIHGLTLEGKGVQKTLLTCNFSTKDYLATIELIGN